MKKIYLLLMSIIVISCERGTDDNNLNTQMNIQNKIQNKTILNAGSLSLREVDPNNRCGNVSSYNPINIDPNMYYAIPDGPVYYFDNTCNTSPDCQDLSHFLDKYMIYNTRFSATFFGYNETSAFLSYGSGSVYNGRVDQDEYNAMMYGDIFSSPMSNDAINTVLQAIQNQINIICASNNKIVAVHYVTDNFICDVKTTGINFSIKYSPL